jgi:alpha-tubulin suppressor-like RCC1 family protein
MIASQPQAIAGITNAAQISAGYEHTCARLGDGTVRCWGKNDHGQLGDGTTEARNAPVAVVGVTGATDLAASGGGGGFACALVAGGAAKCWGRGFDGGLGDGNAEEHDAARAVDVSGLRGAVAIEVGGNALHGHACAVTADNSVVCWGYGGYIGLPPSSSQTYLQPHPMAL